eukprot:Clim_evm8s229 gene=Clim_evmTU8s229
MSMVNAMANEAMGKDDDAQQNINGEEHGLDGNAANDAGKYAYVTLLYGSTELSLDQQFIGTRVLGQSIRESGTPHEYLVLVTPGVSNEYMRILADDGWTVRMVDKVKNPIKGAPAYFDQVYTKLAIWNLTEYDSLVFLDTDTQLVQNVDELFGCGDFCASFRHSDKFNTGVMVLRPDKEAAIEIMKATAELGSYTGGDQGFLNEYFADLNNMEMFQPHLKSEYGGRGIRRLPAGYNSDVAMYYINSHWVMDQEDIHIVHHTLGPSKPWKWWTYPALDLHWSWAALRDRLPGGPNQGVHSVSRNAFFPLVRMLVTGGIIFALTEGLRRCAVHRSSLLSPSAWQALDWLIGPRSVPCRVFGVLAFLLAVKWAITETPLLMHYRKAWVVCSILFVGYLGSLFYAYCRILYVLGYVVDSEKKARFIEPEMTKIFRTKVGIYRAFLMMLILMYIWVWACVWGVYQASFMDKHIGKEVQVAVLMYVAAMIGMSFFACDLSRAWYFTGDMDRNVPTGAYAFKAAKLLP